METKLYQIKQLNEITADYLFDFEKLSVRFDKREVEAAFALAYETSRNIEKLNVLNDLIRMLVNEVQEESNER